MSEITLSRRNFAGFGGFRTSFIINYERVTSIIVSASQIRETMAYEWIRTRGSTIPPNAFIGGYDGKIVLFVARARNPHDGRMTGGKAALQLPGCHISYGGREIIVPEYDVLTVPPQYHKNLVWAYCVNGKLPRGAIPTDYEARLYVARFFYKDTLTPGKYRHGHESRMALIGYGGEEKSSCNYEVLCYNH